MNALLLTQYISGDTIGGNDIVGDLDELVTEPWNSLINNFPPLTRVGHVLNTFFLMLPAEFFAVFCFMIICIIFSRIVKRG